MQCEICRVQTTMRDAYYLPVIVSHNGKFQNLVACNKLHRDEWHAKTNVAEPSTNEFVLDTVTEKNENDA